ncbi:MAG: RluA family pseudouridine synthase [Armatimonadota bacterium]|nr:RluA family pseudouridine synthase [bacterium]MCS7308761.1 RluA family pseudouridine synthase [Armatimonadota bacterium]MDW8103515.1 RluA family pseudouridine synthase [Armatimonadota bacterium]MDW8289307.1 RluA family pseudouridine synthase [Armatimonadota bacterium]
METAQGVKVYYASPADEGARLDLFLAQRLPEVSRAQIQRWIEAGLVELNGRSTKPNARLRAGDEVYLEPPPPLPAEPQPEPIPLQVLYEDEHLAVVVKPRGMVTHPAPGAESGTLVNAALARFGRLSSIGAPDRPGIVHRLDKDTTGLILIALTEQAHHALAQQIQQRLVERRYLALVWGVPRFHRALVDAPIGRSESDRTRMSVKAALHDPNARPAVTEFELRENLGTCSLLEARLHTGRTHQVRVHAAYIGHPVVGDPVYGAGRSAAQYGWKRADARTLDELVTQMGGQALHAYQLTFTHPVTTQPMRFTAEPPEDMQAIIDWLRSRKEESL